MYLNLKINAESSQARLQAPETLLIVAGARVRGLVRCAKLSLKEILYIVYKNCDMSQKVTSSHGGEGGNTKTPSRIRRVCFTLNNWTIEEQDSLRNWMSQKTQYFVFGREVGNEKTPHLQGYFEVKNAVRFETLKELNARAHWEVAKGNRKSNQDYCTKDGDYECSIEVRCLNDILKQEMLDEYKNVVWKPWQAEILKIVESEPDIRTINWYWEETGNVGKTFLCNYICAKYDIIICDGKKDNVFNQVNIMINEKKLRPKGIILDIPRTSYDYVNYGVIEKLKDRVIYSGKYEGGQIFLPRMFVVCFANERPHEDALSKDRWNIKEITHQ